MRCFTFFFRDTIDRCAGLAAPTPLCFFSSGMGTVSNVSLSHLLLLISAQRALQNIDLSAAPHLSLLVFVWRRKSLHFFSPLPFYVLELGTVYVLGVLSRVPLFRLLFLPHKELQKPSSFFLFPSKKLRRVPTKPPPPPSFLQTQVKRNPGNCPFFLLLRERH